MTSYKHYKPVELPNPDIRGRNYNNFKNYLGITAIPSFTLNSKVTALFDLSKNVDPSSELEFGMVKALSQQIPAGTGWPANACYAMVVQTPEQNEYVYLKIAALMPGRAVGPPGPQFETSTFNIYFSSLANISTAPAAFVPSTNPSIIPQLILLQTTSVATAYMTMDNSLLPLYVPPKGNLVLFPTDASNATVAPVSTDAFYLKYVRIKRKAGLGPLVD